MAHYICRHCDLRFLDPDTLAEHEGECHARPQQADPAPSFTTLLDRVDAADVASLGARRFNRTQTPQAVSPLDALEAALEEARASGDKPTHAIVLFGMDDPDSPGCSLTRVFQAGAYRHHGQMGLLLEGMHLLRETG